MRALIAALLLAVTVGIAGCAPKDEPKAGDKPAAAPAAKPADGAAK